MWMNEVLWHPWTVIICAMEEGKWEQAILGNFSKVTSPGSDKGVIKTCFLAHILQCGGNITMTVPLPQVLCAFIIYTSSLWAVGKACPSLVCRRKRRISAVLQLQFSCDTTGVPPAHYGMFLGCRVGLHWLCSAHISVSGWWELGAPTQRCLTLAEIRWWQPCLIQESHHPPPWTPPWEDAQVEWTCLRRRWWILLWHIQITLCWPCPEWWFSNPKEDLERAPFVALWLMKSLLYNPAINCMGLLGWVIGLRTDFIYRRWCNLPFGHHLLPKPWSFLQGLHSRRDK